MRERSQEPAALRKVRGPPLPCLPPGRDPHCPRPGEDGRDCHQDTTLQWKDLAPCARGQPWNAPQRPPRGRGLGERESLQFSEHSRMKPALEPRPSGRARLPFMAHKGFPPTAPSLRLTSHLPPQASPSTRPTSHLPHPAVTWAAPPPPRRPRLPSAQRTAVPVKIP